ncbi:hypothetical protein COBT_003056 [Conglomerata obtusa]
MEETSYQSNLNIALLSIIPAVSSFVDLYLLDTKKNQFFNTITSVVSIVLLIVPFIFRNYLKLANDFDYTICSLSCCVILAKFVVFSFTDKTFKTFITNILSSNNAMLYTPFIITILLDILISLVQDKSMAAGFKIISSIGLMVFMIGFDGMKIENPLLTYVLFTVMTFLMIILSKKGNKLATTLCIVVYYCMLVRLRMNFTSVYNEKNAMDGVINYTKSLISNAFYW